MKTNLRKEQEKLAVLLEITDTAKKNSDIIKGAESRMIITEEMARVLSDKKTTVLKKELQFVLYFLKKDELVNVENRGYYTANEKTAEELIKTARIIDEALKADEKAPCLLIPEALDEMGIVLSTYPIQSIQAEESSGFEIVSVDEPTLLEDDKTESEEKNEEDLSTSDTQVKKTEKQGKKDKKKSKKTESVKKSEDSNDLIDKADENNLPADKNDENDVF